MLHFLLRFLQPLHTMTINNVAKVDQCRLTSATLALLTFQLASIGFPPETLLQKYRRFLEINCKMPTYPFLICRFGFFRVYYFCTNIIQDILCTHATIRICPKLCIKSYHSSETIEGPDQMFLRRFHFWDKSFLCWASSQPQIQYRQVRFTFFYSRQHSNYFNIFHLSLKTAKLAIQQWNTKCH